MRLDLNDKFSLSLRGDVGGFDVGSQFTYNAVGLVGYNISRVAGLWLDIGSWVLTTRAGAVSASSSLI